MTLPNRLGYNSKQHALQKRYLQQQQQQQQQSLAVAAHQFDPNYALSQQQLGYGTQMTQASQYGASFNQPHYQTQQLQMFNNPAGGMMTNQGMMQTQLMSPQMSPAMSQGNQMMPSPPAKKTKKRKSQAASSNAGADSSQTFSTPEIQKKKKAKKKAETTENEESIPATPTPPAIQFGNSGIIKSPKVIKEEITQINEVFEKAIVTLIDRFKNVKIREKTHVYAVQPSLLTFKEEEKYKPKEEELITTFPSNASSSGVASQSNTQEGEEGSASTSVAPQQSLFNSNQQVKLIQNYPVFSVNRSNDTIDNLQVQEEEKNRRRLFYKDGQSEYITPEDVIDEIIRDTDCYFKRELMIHSGLAETPNNIISFLHVRFLQFIQNNRSKFEKFLASADNASQLTMFLSQNEEFQPLMHQLRSVVEHAGHNFEEKTREEASSIVLQSGSTADVTDEAIDQFQSTQDDMNQDYSKNVSLIEMTARDILLVFLGKDANSERHEDVTTFLERFKELQKQYRVECSYIDDGLKKWQDTFERALNSQSSFRIVSFEEKHRCKKSLEARFALMKQLLKDKFLTKVLSLQENTLTRSKRRGNLPRHATNVLKSWLYSHFLHPYPTEGEKKDLCMETGLTLTQVNNWFINQRVRTWRPMLESMLDGDQKDKTTPSKSEGKKRGKKNQQQQQSPIPQPTQQIPPQMVMNQNIMGIPDSMGSPNYAYANWSSNQYGDPNFPFFPGDVTDEQQ